MFEVATEAGWRSRLNDFLHQDVMATLTGRPQPVRAPAQQPPDAPMQRAPEPAPESAPRRLTRGAKFIAFYVFMVSYSAFGRGLHFDSLHDIRRDLIIVTGLVGSILLFRRKRSAKTFFTLWAFLIALGLTPFGAGPDAGPFWMRALSTALGTGLLLLINREVDRNVVEDWERDEFID